MTSQDPQGQNLAPFPRSPWGCTVESESETTESRAGGPFPVPRPFPVSLFLSFFLSFFEFQRFKFPFLVSLLFLLALMHGHFCFVVVCFLDFLAPFSLLSLCHPLRKIHMHDECRQQGDFFVTCTVWRNESATLTQLCQNTSFRGLQVCFRYGSAAGGQQASSSTIPRRWRTRSRNPRSRMKTTRSSATSLPIWRVTSSRPFLVDWQGKNAMCAPVCLDVERPLDLRRWDWTRNFPRRHSHREQKRSGERILRWTAAPSL